MDERLRSSLKSLSVVLKKINDELLPVIKVVGGKWHGIEIDDPELIELIHQLLEKTEENEALTVLTPRVFLTQEKGVIVVFRTCRESKEELLFDCNEHIVTLDEIAARAWRRLQKERAHNNLLRNVVKDQLQRINVILHF